LDPELIAYLEKILSAIKFIGSFIFVFGIVVFIHELGHFLTAKLFGVKVEEFALGMGPRIWGFQKGETEYKLCVFPIGGYVKMSGEEPEEAKEKTLSERDYYGQSPFKRFLITFSGPLMNFVLAFVVYLMGIYDLPPVIGPIEKDSTAEKAGCKAGDVIISVDGKKIKTFSEAQELIYETKSDLVLEVKREDKLISLEVKKSLKEEEDILGDPIVINDIGIDNYMEPVINEVAPLTPASFVKLKSGDRILSINGKKVHFWQNIFDILNTEEHQKTLSEFSEWENAWNKIYETKEMPTLVRIVWLEIERNKEKLKLPIVLQSRKMEKLIPLKTEEDKQEYLWFIGLHPFDIRKVYRYSPIASISKSMQKMVASVKFIVKVFGKLFQGKLGKKALGGPIMIGKMIKQTADSGFTDLLIFTAILSLHLGLINYFPFPALDGGHMAFSLLEMVRRKPLSLKTMEYIQKTGFAILIALIIYVSYQDILRLVGGS